MTQRQRNAIVDYWLCKQWMTWSLHAMRRMVLRRSFRFLAFLLSVSFGFCPMCFAAEAKATEQTSAWMKLLSKEIKPAPATTEPAAKKKGALPDPEKADEKAEGTIKKVKGTVSGMSRYGIAVEYGQDEKSTTLEMWANFLSSTTLTGAKKFSDLAYGDKVELTYKELKGGSKKILKSVKLISKKPKEAPESASGAEI